MSTVVSLTGSVEIAGVTIPVGSLLPPPASGLLFEYDLPQGAAPANPISIGSFTTWLSNNLNVPDLNLPSSLTSLSVGVSRLVIDTAGIFDIAVLIGSESGGTWTSTWTPISGLPFSFTGLQLEVDYGGAVLNVSEAADSGATTLTFAATTGVTAEMAVAGAGIAPSTTVSSMTATTVTLSTATSAEVPSGTPITFTAGQSTPTPVVLNVSEAADSGATTLTFAATTGVTADMAVAGTSIAPSTTVESVTATTVTLSTGTSGPVSAGAQITFTATS